MIEFKEGDRVRVLPHRAVGYVQPFRRMIAQGRPATVLIAAGRREHGLYGKTKIEFDVLRKGAQPKQEWWSTRELEILA